MAATPYKPVSWNGEPISNAKLNQMCSNDQWLFENAARVRFNYGGPRDAGVKIIAGKSPFSTSSLQHVWVDVYFGSFFSAGCKPSVMTQAETTGLGRKDIHIVGFGGEVDHRGFRAVVYTDEVQTIESPGWVHWQAVGY